MKKMTCSQLGGACELEFFANSFDEIAEKSKQHGMEIFELKEAGHMTAMEKMSKLMADASTMQDWMEKKREEFEGLPNEA
jgi:predicted small metal-binding protein